MQTSCKEKGLPLNLLLTAPEVFAEHRGRASWEGASLSAMECPKEHTPGDECQGHYAGRGRHTQNAT